MFLFNNCVDLHFLMALRLSLDCYQMLLSTPAAIMAVMTAIVTTVNMEAITSITSMADLDSITSTVALDSTISAAFITTNHNFCEIE